LLHKYNKMSNIIKLNSYTKGRLVIRGSFLVSTDDPNDCLITTKTTTPQNEFIVETYATGLLPNEE